MLSSWQMNFVWFNTLKGISTFFTFFQEICGILWNRFKPHQMKTSSWYYLANRQRTITILTCGILWITGEFVEIRGVPTSADSLKNVFVAQVSRDDVLRFVRSCWVREIYGGRKELGLDFCNCVSSALVPPDPASRFQLDAFSSNLSLSPLTGPLH